MGWFWPRKDIAAPQPREEKVRSMGWGLALFVSLFAILSAREEDDDAEAPMRRERRKRN